MFAQFLFALKSGIWVLTNSNKMQISENSKSRGENDSDYNIAIFTSNSLFLLWLDEITGIIP